MKHECTEQSMSKTLSNIALSGDIILIKAPTVYKPHLFIFKPATCWANHKSVYNHNLFSYFNALQSVIYTPM